MAALRAAGLIALDFILPSHSSLCAAPAWFEAGLRRDGRLFGLAP
jgi:hypothetical protein